MIAMRNPIKAYVLNRARIKAEKEEYARIEQEWLDKAHEILLNYDTTCRVMGELACLLQVENGDYILTRNLQHVHEFARFSIKPGLIKVYMSCMSLYFEPYHIQWLRKFEWHPAPHNHKLTTFSYSDIEVRIHDHYTLQKFLDHADELFNQP